MLDSSLPNNTYFFLLTTCYTQKNNFSSFECFGEKTHLNMCKDSKIIEVTDSQKLVTVKGGETVNGKATCTSWKKTTTIICRLLLL